MLAEICGNGVVMRKSEQGQAIVELTISLVAVMTVFLGVIFAFALGDANVEGIIQARGTSDDYAGNGRYSGDSGQHILDWSTGSDERYLTNDDEPNIGGNDTPSYFTGELTTDKIDLTSGFEENHVQYNLAADLKDVSSIFLTMAHLTESTKVTDPYDQELLQDLQGAFQTLITDSDITIKNSAYMPVFYEEE